MKPSPGTLETLGLPRLWKSGAGSVIEKELIIVAFGMELYADTIHFNRKMIYYDIC